MYVDREVQRKGGTTLKTRINQLCNIGNRCQTLLTKVLKFIAKAWGSKGIRPETDIGAGFRLVEGYSASDVCCAS